MSSRRRVHPLVEDERQGNSSRDSPASSSVFAADMNAKRPSRLPPIRLFDPSSPRHMYRSPAAGGSRKLRISAPRQSECSSSRPVAQADPYGRLGNSSPTSMQESVSRERRRRTIKRLNSADSHLEIFKEERAGGRSGNIGSRRVIRLQSKAETDRKRLTSSEAASVLTVASRSHSPTVLSTTHEVSVNGIPPHSVEENTATEGLSNQQRNWESYCVALDRLQLKQQEESENEELIPLATLGMTAIPIAITASHFIIDDRSILVYFAKLSVADESVCVSFSFVDHLLSKGANVNAVDDLGQSALHAVAKDWGTDVLQYLIDRGAHPNLQDQFGRTPLHVAASTNAADIICVLLEQGADHTLCTHGENQSPLHFAARSDAVEALRALLEVDADIERRDYKGRTPLQLAAELDRSESVRCLLDVKPTPANVGVYDYSGHMALTSMVATMPPVTKNALNQFHRTSRVYRKQLYYLNLIERPPPEKTGSGYRKAVRSPLEMIVHHQHHDLITHPVIRKLIAVKWRQFGRLGTILQLIIFFIFLVMLTVSAVAVDFRKKYNYHPFTDSWWRIFAEVISFVLFVYQVYEELHEIYRSRKHHKRWVTWRKAELENDMPYCHPRFPDEKEYLVKEVDKLGDSAAAYFSEAWNYVDWLSYLSLLAAFTSHVVDVFDHSETLARWHARVMCVALILAWFRLLKYVRAFPFLGPFVVILQSITADIARFFFLYLVIYIPYAASFWIFFGDRGVPGFQSLPAGLFTLFRITLVDEYAFDDMHSEDSIMSYILVGSFLALAAIVGLNLLIALMSDTFQRVYDNAKANAIMQQASIILSLEEKLTEMKLQEIRREIHEECSPLEEFFDDDDDEGEDLKKMTFRIYDEVLELKNQLEEWQEELIEQKENEATSISQLQEEIKQLKDILQKISVIPPGQ